MISVSRLHLLRMEEGCVVILQVQCCSWLQYISEAS
jgi:hypothetical protein